MLIRHLVLDRLKVLVHGRGRMRRGAAAGVHLLPCVDPSPRSGQAFLLIHALLRTRGLGEAVQAGTPARSSFGTFDVADVPFGRGWERE